jgi:hypothetical protein
MTVLFKLTIAGSDSGPFDLYSNLDGYDTPFEENVSRAALTASSGYSTTVPDNATIVRIKSTGVCVNFIDITLSSSNSLICGTWNSITYGEEQPSEGGSWAYDSEGNEYWDADPGAYYQILGISGSREFDFYKLLLPGEIINTATSTARVLSYTAQAATNLINDSGDLPAPDPQWEDVLYETTDTNTIYNYSVALNIWEPIPYGQVIETYDVDGALNWNFNFDYSPPYIGILGDPTSGPPQSIQYNNFHPLLTMTLGGNLVTTGGRVIPINETSTYTSILQRVESESTGCQNFRPTITGNLCGYWTSNVYPMTPPNTENRIDGYIDFSSKINGETIDSVNSWVRVRSLATLNGGGSTITNDGSGDLIFDEPNNRGYISQSSIVVFQVNDPSAAMTLYFEGYIRTYEGKLYSLSTNTYSDRTGMNGNNTFNEC